MPREKHYRCHDQRVLVIIFQLLTDPVCTNNHLRENDSLDILLREPALTEKKNISANCIPYPPIFKRASFSLPASISSEKSRHAYMN